MSPLNTKQINTSTVHRELLVIDPKTGNVKEPVHQEIIGPVNPQPPAVWQCDAAVKSGCMDLCKLNKETGVFSVVKNPSEIADGIPTSDPDYNELYPFYKGCMVPCEGVTSPINFGSFTACKGLDSTPPSIFGIMVPGGGGGAPAPVPVDTSLAAPFTEPVDPVSVNTSTFTVSDAFGNLIDGGVSYDAATYTALFTPSRNFDYSTTYRATITTGVTDTAGNPLPADFSWDFTTEAAPDVTPPVVILTSPLGDETGVLVSSLVSVTFSEPIDISTIDGSISVNNPDGPPVPGDFFFTDDNATVIFDPTADLANDTTYSVIITTGLKDLAGNALAEDVAWSFTTVAEIRGIR